MPRSNRPLPPLGRQLYRRVCRLLGSPSWLAWPLLAVLGPALWGTLLASCGESEPAVPPRPDAGVACEPGTQSCACAEANACDRGLLCSSGRCLPTEGSSGNEPEIRLPAPACARPPCDPGPSSSN